jgi:hypothetical protein
MGTLFAEQDQHPAREPSLLAGIYNPASGCIISGMRKTASILYMASAFCMTLIAACTQTTVKSGKVYDPGEVAASCAGNLDLSGAAAMSLAAAFRDSNGYITEDFKEKAEKYIAESENTVPSPDDPQFQQYISCLKASAVQ